MKTINFIASTLLILIGLIGYFGATSFGAEKTSVTALIPAFIGVIQLAGAFLSIKYLKHGMHVSATVALLGLIAGLGRLASTGFALNGTSALFVLIMSVICFIFVILAIRSFIAVRKQAKTA